RGRGHGRTGGGKGVTKTTHHGSNPPRQFGKTRRSHRIDGGCQRLASCIWAQEGATATVSVLDRRGKRVVTSYLGHMPQSGHEPFPDHSGRLLQPILTKEESHLF